MKVTRVLIPFMLLLAGCGSYHWARGGRMNPLVLRPEIIVRDAWDTGLVSGRFLHQTPKSLVVLDEGSIAMQITLPPKYLNYVREHSGGRDIPCHYYIDRDGRIFEGRIPEVQGDLGSTGSAKNGDVLISLLDDTAQREPSKKSLDALTRLCAWLCADRNLSPEKDLHTLRGLGQGDRPGVFLELYYQQGKLLEGVRKLYPPLPEEPEF